jgi:uncharacterized phiE125 gp8 family phage protein
MAATLLAGPALEPISLADAKAHLKIDHAADDDLLQAAIVSARFHVEAATRRALIAQQWRIHLDAWPRSRIVRLSVAPLLSVDAVTVTDANGEATVLDPADYEADVASVPARLVLVAGAPAPGRSANGIAIDVTAGYGATSVEVPAALRQAVLMLVAHWYEHRGAVGHDLAVLVAPLGFETLVAPYRILSL